MIENCDPSIRKVLNLLLMFVEMTPEQVSQVYDLANRAAGTLDLDKVTIRQEALNLVAPNLDENLTPNGLINLLIGLTET